MDRFLKRGVDFISRPTHSRTVGLLIVFVLLGAVSLTVIVAQQQQQIRQRASTGPGPTPTCGGNGQQCCPSSPDCQTGYRCSNDNFCDPLPTATRTPTPTLTPHCGSNGERCCSIPGVSECNPGYTCHYTSDEGDGFCVPLPAATRTPTPTPTPIFANCSNFTTCTSCINATLICGWNGDECETGTPLCPAGYKKWYLNGCENVNNLCAPTPTPTRTPAPTRTPTVTPTPKLGGPTATRTPNTCYQSDDDSITPFYTEKCNDYNGTFTDNCDGRTKNIYKCSFNLCKLVSIEPCDPGETCKVQTNGKPVCVSGTTATSTPTPDDDDDDSNIQITTRPATNIEDTEARLIGEIDLNSSDHAFVWFEYGKDDEDLDEETPRVRIDSNDDEKFSERVRDLEENQPYYFRAVGEGENNDIDRGSILNFRTDDDDDNDGPTPTPTPIPGGTVPIRFAISLGKAGEDIVTNPKNPVRDLDIEIFDPLTDKKKHTLRTEIKYDDDSKEFIGDKELQPGIYNIRIKADRYLRRLIPAVKITLGEEINLEANLIPGDINDTEESFNRIDILDYNSLRDCFEEKAENASCGGEFKPADLNDDGKVNGIDFNRYAKSLSVQEGD